MKKFIFMFLLAAAVAGAFTFALAQDTQGEEKKFVIHGEVRQRADYIDNWSDFDSDFSDSALFFPYRARIAAEGHFSKDVIGYAEFQTFGLWGDTDPVRGRTGFTFPNIDQNYQDNFSNATSGTWNNNVHLYQGWIALNNIGGSKFSLKIGRQEVVKGSEMLLGDLDFYSGISHDGMVGSFNNDSFGLDLWWTRPLQHTDTTILDPGPPEVSFDVPTHESQNFYGGWVDFKKIPNKIGVSVYLMYFEQGQTTTNLDGFAFYTIGARANKEAEAGKNGFAWNAELAFQSGDFTIGPDINDTGDVSASAFEGMFGYNLNAGGNDHLFQIKYVMATGNKDTADPDFDPAKDEAFHPLFQDFHMRYGLSDAFTLSDLTALSLGWNMTKKNHIVGVDYWMYELTEDVDIAGSSKSDLGSELDAWYKFQYNPNTQIMGGLVYFMPGDVIEASTINNTSDPGLRLVGNLRLRF
jgi:hypothetical protein